MDGRFSRLTRSIATLSHKFSKFRIFRLKAPVHHHVFGLVFMKEDEGVADVVVAFVDGGGDLLHHLLLGLRGYARRCFDVTYRHFPSPLRELPPPIPFAPPPSARLNGSHV